MGSGRGEEVSHQHYPGCGCGAAGNAAPDYDNYPSQWVDPRQAMRGDPAMPDQPSLFETWLTDSYNGYIMASNEAADVYPGLPDYVTWDVYTPQVLLRGALPGPQQPPGV